MSSKNLNQSLNANWKVSLAAGNAPIALPDQIPATVPGSIHTDLMAAGLIPDPFLDDNERLLAWIGYCDWKYSTEFDFEENQLSHTDLVFEGIDTVAAIYLNGELLGEVMNQHRSYRFGVKDKLKNGRNLLEIHFSSPIKYADRMSLELGYRPHVNHHPYNSIRKMAANFGWDWGIDTSTVGLWKPVSLESYNARLAEVRPVTKFDNATGTVDLHVVIEGEPSGEITASIAGSSVAVAAVRGANLLQLKLSNPKLWWPTGEGEQNLYELGVRLGSESEPESVFETQIGFREITVNFPESEDGHGFEFHVNGQPIFIRGVNWIPNDAFLHRITRDSLRERLTQAKNANINLIRVWGGGIYESEDFYQLCNELGLMVWQDFLFACASYSEEGLGTEVEAEARENIARIMKHPSLALWNGNNENLWGHQEWNWQQRLEGKSWGAGFYFELLPKLVAELDPGRDYTPGSPYSPDPDKLHNDPSAGSVHIWDLWNQKDYPHYLDYRPRFVAEFGWQGPANWATIQQSISDDPLTPESPGMIIHQKAMSGNDKLTDGLVNHFALPNNMSDWHWAMQLNQANAIRFGLEHMRSEFPRCMGSVVWQLNDCWPVTSWAAIDGAGRQKPLYYSISQSYAPLLVTFSQTEKGLAVNLLNNSSNTPSGALSIQLMDYSGKVIAEHSEQVNLSAHSKYQLDVPSSLVESAPNTMLVATFGTKRALHFFSDYKFSALAAADFEAKLNQSPDGYQLKITAKNLIRDLLLMIDRVDSSAEVNSGLITLLPGESVVFDFKSEKKLKLEDLIAGSVLRSANQLVVR